MRDRIGRLPMIKDFELPCNQPATRKHVERRKMIAKQRWSYYCEYCGKSSGRRDVIEKHEKGCTCNPERKCGFCQTVGETQRPFCELVTVAEQCPPKRGTSPGISNNRDITELGEFAHNCPGCILTAIRNAEIWADDFDFRNAAKGFWMQVNPGICFLYRSRKTQAAFERAEACK